MADQNHAEPEPKSGSGASSRIEEVSERLAKTFKATGKPVPEFEYTPHNVSHLHGLLIISKAKDKVARLVARDFRQKASEYRSQAGKLKLLFGMFTRVAIKQLDRITGQGQSAISVEDTLKIIIYRCSFEETGG
ncbi:hypothetical protein HN51_027742 [Arachis hypogaea]